MAGRLLNIGAFVDQGTIVIHGDLIAQQTAIILQSSGNFSIYGKVDARDKLIESNRPSEKCIVDFYGQVTATSSIQMNSDASHVTFHNDVNLSTIQIEKGIVECRHRVDAVVSINGLNAGFILPASGRIVNDNGGLYNPQGSAGAFASWGGWGKTNYSPSIMLFGSFNVDINVN